MTKTLGIEVVIVAVFETVFKGSVVVIVPAMIVVAVWLNDIAY